MEELQKALHATIERVTGDMERMSFNTAIAALIEFAALLVPMATIPRSVAEPFVLLLAPLAPHIAEELWHRMGHEETLAYEPWPEADTELLAREEIKLAVQVNGKYVVRCTCQLTQGKTASSELLAPTRMSHAILRAKRWSGRFMSPGASSISS